MNNARRYDKNTTGKITDGMKASVFSLGCKVNQIEGQSMIARLREFGVDATDELVCADFYILNTCSVTGEADRKSRQTVARMNKLSPDAPVYVCGCSSQNAPQVFAEKKNVRLIIGTKGKNELVDSVMSDIIHLKSGDFTADSVSGCNLIGMRGNSDNLCDSAIKGATSLEFSPSKVYEEMPQGAHTKTRAFIKVQDGCNRFCSYCIVPYLRGRSRSRPIADIVGEAERQAADSGELVISGINISAYGADIDLSLVDLVHAIEHIPARKRFGSLECNVIDERLLSAMAQCGFCDHFHLSLQSGSDGVLRRMNRHYTAEEYMQKVRLIREFFPNAGITTDIIAGFPCETLAEHQETLAFMGAVGFSDAHIFPYSMREGTVAAKYEMIPSNERVRRAAELSRERDRLRAEFLQSQLGSRALVYVEDEDGGYSAGYTSNYIKVYSHAPVGSLVTLTLKEIYKQGVKGE